MADFEHEPVDQRIEIGGEMTDYFLSRGKHERPEDGRCAMEWVAYLAGEPHSDSPVSASPVLTAFCAAFNDGLPDSERQRLRPYLARTIGTRGDGLDEQRAWMATDWLIRTYAPAWLDLAHLDEEAARLSDLPPVLANESLARSADALNHAKREATAARNAAWNYAVWDAAGGHTAGDAATAAARAARWNIERDVATATATALAVAVAVAAATAATGDAATAAARAALTPTVLALQSSAFDLLDRMLPTEIIQLPVVKDAEAVALHLDSASMIRP